MTYPRNNDANRHMRMSFGMPRGTQYGSCRSGYFTHNQRKVVNSRSIPRLYKILAVAMMSSKERNEMVNVITQERKMPTHGVSNLGARTAKMLGRRPRSAVQVLF
jgi:hypothetical protein